MIYENIEIKDSYFELSNQLIERLKKQSLLKKPKLVIGIGGESGSGKSVTAICLKLQLEKLNTPCLILHQDSYFKLPPKENHQKRKQDLSWVGSNEVQLDLLQNHIEQFKSGKEKTIVPVVDYEQNIFLKQVAIFKNQSVLIVEGVYTFLLKQLDYKIFMERNYQDTIEERKMRSREVYDPFVEQVLAIEHAIVFPLKKLADALVRKDYSFE